MHRILTWLIGLALLPAFHVAKAETLVFPLTDDGFDPTRQSRFEYRYEKPDLATTSTARQAEEWKLSSHGWEAFDNDGSVFWIRYRVHNTSSVKDWVIFDEANYNLRDVCFYIDYADGSTVAGSSGTRMPPEKRVLRDRYVGMPFTLPPGAEATIRIRLNTDVPHRSAYSIMPADEFAHFSQGSQAVLGGYLGLILLAVLMNAIFYLSFRDPAYAWYTAFCASFALACFTNAGFWHQWMWPIFGEATGHVGHILCAITVVLPVPLAIPFSQRFLNTRQRTPRIHRLLNVFCAFTILVMILQAVGIPRLVESILLPISFVGPIVLLLTTAVMYARQSYGPAKLYVWGWAVLSGSTLIWLGQGFGVLPANFFTANSPFFGEMVEIVLLSVAILLRISLLQRAEAEAAAAHHESEEMKTLLRVVSHDLVNPLTVVLEWSRIGVAKSQDDADQLKRWDKVLRAADRQREILEHVKLMRTLADQKKQLSIGSVDLGRAIDVLHETFESRCAQKELILHADVTRFRGVLVRAEESSLCHQVINNIVSNAIKFSQPGGIITVDILTGPTEVAVTIRDRGIGVPPDLLPGLFEPNTPTTRRGTAGEAGTGYGMPLVKAYMDRYGGRIEVQSRDVDRCPDDHGTTVRITFRRADAPAKAA